MAEIKLFTKSYCPYCHKALDLLEELNLEFTNIEVDTGSDEQIKEWEELKEKTGHTTVPMVWIDGKLIGGCDDLFKLHESGKLK